MLGKSTGPKAPKKWKAIGNITPTPVNTAPATKLPFWVILLFFPFELVLAKYAYSRQKLTPKHKLLVNIIQASVRFL